MKSGTMNLKLATVAKYKDKYFFTALKLNALFVYDLESKDISYVDSFQTEQEVYCMYIQSFLYKQEIWFLPAEAEKIAIFNTLNMQIEYMPIDCKSRHCVSKNKYNSFIRFDESYVCFIPRGLQEALVINLETRKVEKYYKIARENEEFQNAVFVDHILYFYPWHGYYKVSLDLISEKLNYEKWENYETYGDAIYDEKTGNIYHAPARGNHVLIDDVNGNIVEKRNMNSPLNAAGYHTFYSSSYEDEILFWGVKGVITINSQKQEIVYSQIREEDDGVILVPVACSKEAYVFGGNQILQYNDIQKKYTSIKLVITLKALMTQIGKAGKRFCDLYRYTEHDFETENVPVSLNGFIYMMKYNLITKDINYLEKKSDKQTRRRDFSMLFSL